MTEDQIKRLKAIDTALDRLAYHLEGIEPYHPCIDRTMNWWCAASTEVQSLLEEVEKEK